MTSRLRALALALALGSGACGGSSSPPPARQDAATPAMTADGGRAEAGTPDASHVPPTFTAEEKAQLALLAPATLPPPPKDVSNKWADDAAAARLGQRFFMDPGFSGKLLDGDNDGTPETLGKKGETGKVSCAGCHVPKSGFIDDRTLNKQISLAAGWVLRRTPSLLDVGQAKVIMWDGRRDALYNQPFGPIENPLEMNSSRLYVAQQIIARYKADYEAVFGPLPNLSHIPPLDAALTGCDDLMADRAVCHGMPGDKAEYDGLSAADQDAVTRIVVNFGKALGAYQRRLTCGPGRFDRWVQGDAAALDASEQRGAQIFLGKGKCVQCHSGPYFSDQKFHNVGLRPATVAVVFIDANDEGAIKGLAASLADPLNTRGKYSDGDDGRLFEPTPAHAGAFRTPMLRCVSKHPSFMHTAQMGTLEEVISFFDLGGHGAGFPGESELMPLGLTAAERADLEAFIRTLEGPGPAAELLQ
jgi:cytochrome c peroxidase